MCEGSSDFGLRQETEDNLETAGGLEPEGGLKTEIDLEAEHRLDEELGMLIDQGLLGASSSAAASSAACPSAAVSSPTEEFDSVGAKAAFEQHLAAADVGSGAVDGASMQSRGVEVGTSCRDSQPA
jgi:hypothetical protein